MGGGYFVKLGLGQTNIVIDFSNLKNNNRSENCNYYYGVFCAFSFMFSGVFA